MKKTNQLLFICFTTCIIYFSLSCKNDSNEDLPLNSADSVSIGLYIDNGAWPELRTPTKNIVKQIGLPYSLCWCFQFRPCTIIDIKPDTYGISIN